MLHVKITWPLFFALLLALVVWLLRASSPPAQPVPQRRAPIRPSRPPRRRVPLHRQNTDDFVIDQNGPASHATGTGDYAAETERLDREAADRGRQVHDETIRSYEEIKERMNARNAERRERNPRR